ncbi:MAG TPA: PAS domain S-box protein [Solirubrobacteraceae bacterium]|nr:PAS domain S-box protein [Solirubrobacteraceae bacterium]
MLPLSALAPARAPADAGELGREWEQAFRWSTRGIAVTDAATGLIRAVNPAFAAMHGGRPDDFVGRPSATVLAPAWQDKVAGLVEEVGREGHLRVTTEHVRLDGSVFPVETEAITTVDGDGRALQRMSWSEDLSERRAAEAAHRETGAMFEAAFANAPNGVAMIGLDGRFLRVNDALCTMLGRAEAELVGHLTVEVCHPDDLAATHGAYEALNTARQPVAIEKRYLRPDGEVVWAFCRGLVVRDERDEPSYIVTHFVDFTARKLAERRQAEADMRFERAFSDAPIGMALVHLDGAFLKVNRSLREITGYSEQELLSLTLPEITHPEDLDADRQEVQALLAGRIDRYAREQICFAARGQLIWTKLARSLVRDADGQPVHFIVHVEDISERKRMEASLQRLADHDPLTDLWNRRRFEEELRRQLGRCQRYGEKAALLLMDLDGFKAVNDSFGHKAGDDLLKLVAGALQRRLRGTDAVARLGGDEFAVLLANVSPDQAAEIAEELHALVAAATLELGGHRICVTGSVGVVFLDERITGEQDAMVQADVAMYDVKLARRDGERSRPTRFEQADDHPDRRPLSAQSIGRAIRVLHCDDSAPYRRLVSEMLVVQPDLEVVGQAHDGESLLEAVAGCDPDLVLLDAAVGGIDDALLARLRAIAPNARLVVLSGRPPEASLLPAVADAFVPKSASFDDLCAVLRATVAR